MALTPQQFTAISLLCCGKNLDQVALSLRVSPRTLYRWRTSHPAFRAELARRQKELRDTVSRRLRLTLLRAVHVVTNEVRWGQVQADRVKAALVLLRHCDLRALLNDPGDPLTATACLDDQIRQERASRNLDPTLAIDDDDRDQFLAHLDADQTFDSPPPPTPTHCRLRHGTPYPTAENAPPPDPEFQI